MALSRARWIALAWLALAVAGGALWALCFDRHTLPVASWLALAPVFFLLERRRAGALVWAHGVVFWLVSIPWIETTVATYGGVAGPLAKLALLALAAALALFQAPLGWLGGRVWRRGGPLAPIGVAAIWTALEWARAHLLTGFPWNLAAYAWADLPGALALAPWLGAYGLTFLVVWVNAGAARAATVRSWRPLAASWAPVAVFLGGAALLAPAAPPPADSASTVHVVQPNAAISTVYDAEAARRDYRELLRMSDAACRTEPGLLVWPESAAWPYTPDAHAFLRDDVAALAARGCPVLFNAATRRRGAVFNSVLLTRPDGTLASTAKRHLVPFGEYVPAPLAAIPGVGKLARNVGDFTAGDSARPLAWGDERLGVSVCYEVIFPAEVAALVRTDASILVTVTNDGWYGDSSAPWQHFRAARFRAAETRRPLVRAALTGVSGIVAADGRVLERLGVGEKGVLTRRVAGRSGVTPAARFPWLVPALASLVGGFAILRRSRRSPK